MLQRSVDGRTDRQTDRQTDKAITIGLPHLRWRGPKKVMANVKVFQKSVKGHGKGHTLKIYGTIRKALS